MKRFTLTAVAFAALTATSAGAVTITPADYDAIFTEDGRTATVDGADISGNEATVTSFTIGGVTFDSIELGALSGDNEVLLAGRALANNFDIWEFSGVTGEFSVDLLNIAGSSAASRGPFETRFTVTANGVTAGTFDINDTQLGQLPSSIFFGELEDASVVIVAQSISGATDYDLKVTLAAVPLPASALLLVGGVAGLGAMKRRKARQS